MDSLILVHASISLLCIMVSISIPVVMVYLLSKTFNLTKEISFTKGKSDNKKPNKKLKVVR